MRTRSRCWSWATLLMTAVAACQEKPSVGGQSGTDGESSQGCPVTDERMVDFDEPTRVGTAAEIRANFERVLAQGQQIALHWNSRVGGTTRLTIEIAMWGEQATFVESAGHVCDHLRVPVTLRFVTEDGLLDATMAGEFEPRTNWLGQVDGQALSDIEVLQRLAMTLGRDDLGVTAFGAFLEFDEFMVTGEIRAPGELEDEGIVPGAFATFETEWREQIGPPDVVATDEPYEAPATFAEACLAAQPTELGLSAFGSEDELIGALAGSWILCTSRSSNGIPHQGLVLAADRTWKHVIEREDELIEQLGFGHEGTYRVFDTSSMNGENAFQLNLLDRAVEYGFSPDGRTLQLVVRPELVAPGLSAPDVPSYDNVYVRTDRPIGPPQLTRQVGERAGEAACDEGEAFVHDFDSIDELRNVLIGTWVVCSGGLRDGATAIAFAADGTYMHLDGAGAVVQSGLYELMAPSMSNRPEDAMPGVYFVDDHARSPGRAVHSLGGLLMSDAPVKLWLRSDTQSVLSPLP